DILQGVQCHYCITGENGDGSGDMSCTVSSPFFGGGDFSAELRRDLTLSSAAGVTTTITGLTMRSGNLVDSLTVHLSDGTSRRFGGTGGDTESRVDVPPGWMLLGLFGGVGGHIHHCGAVLMAIPSISSALQREVATSVPTRVALLEMCRDLDMWDCGMIGIMHRQ
ncbi:unnamed protein product, partial [Symbiodinium microadriaticum]